MNYHFIMVLGVRNSDRAEHGCLSQLHDTLGPSSANILKSLEVSSLKQLVTELELLTGVLLYILFMWRGLSESMMVSGYFLYGGSGMQE